jgi:hypothetical protein
MGDDVAVRVSGEAAVVVELNASEDEWDPVRKRVRVDAKPDAKLAHPSGSWRGFRPSKTVTVW